MRLTKTFFLLIAFGLTAVTTSVRAASDPGAPDTVRVDSVTAFVSGIGVVPVTFFNDEDLLQVEVTLRQFSSQIRIDSFSFAGGRVDGDAYTRLVQINTDSSAAAIYVTGGLSSTPIVPAQGLLGKLYLSYSQTITPQNVRIDSTTEIVGPIQHSTSFRTYVGGVSFKPQFIRGQLKILETPATFDSVWVADVEVAPGAPVAVDVYGFNERNLAQIALALDYGSDDLIFDSVSFLGTRCETAPSKTVQPFVDVHKIYTLIEFAAGVPLPPGSGPIATLHFTVAPGAPNEVILVDSTTVGIVSNTRFMLTPADGSISFVPLFYRGSVTVKTTTDVDNNGESTLPTEYSLSQNYPNPFNPSTIIEFSLPRAGRVEVEVFNILGRRVRKMLDRELPAGVHRLVFDGRGDSGASLATGVYFYRLTTSSFQDTKKMLLMK